MKKEKRFIIDNTGGVDHADLTLKAGINVLRGKNGAGKTSCIDAVVRASGGKASIQRKDGTESGRVEGPGVTLTVKGVVRTDGAAELELADVGPLGRLIDPRLKDSKAAARERIRALVELLDLGVDEPKLLALCGDDRKLFADLAREVDDKAIDNLLEASEKLRHLVHARAREQEGIAGEAQAEVEKTLEECRGILEKLGGGPDGLSKMTPSEAQEELEGAVRLHDRALGQCEAREALEGKQEEIRESLGKAPDLEASRKELAAAAALSKDRWAEVEEIRKREAERVEAATEADRRCSDSERRTEELEIAFELWDRQQKILEEKPVGPSRDEVEKLRTEGIETARALHEKAGLSDTFRKLEHIHDKAVLEFEKAEHKADSFRELANGIPAKLGAFLAEAGAEGLTVYDGRLHVTTEEGPPRDFEHRCSSGERSRAALRVVAKAYGGRVLALDGEVWAGLDPKNQAEFAQAAQEHDLFVITEEPAEGLLRLELRPNAETAIEGD